MKRILAIDPGKSGGIAWTFDDCVSCCAMPETDGDILDTLRKLKASGISECHIEHVCGFVGGAGAGQMFSFGEGFGFLKGCLMALGFSIHLHRPQKWQKAMSLGSKKDHGKRWKNHLKERAQQLYPGLDVTLKTSDALLIFAYGQSVA
jgi:hypothetical protein